MTTTTKLKTFNVVWTEQMSTNVQAENEEKACEKVLNCEHDEASVSAEIDTSPVAYEIR